METNPGTSQALGQDLSLIFMLRPGRLPRIAMLVLGKRPKPQFSSFVSACTSLCDLDKLLNPDSFSEGRLCNNLAGPSPINTPPSSGFSSPF